MPVRSLSRLFRGKFFACLKEERFFIAMLNDLHEKGWVVYRKPPFNGAETVIEYLGQYTHRVPISKDCLVKIEANQVTFRYRDRNANDQSKLITLDTSEFIRRFLLHILPMNS